VVGGRPHDLWKIHNLGIACATVGFFKVNLLHANRPSISRVVSAPFVCGDFAGLDVNALGLADNGGLELEVTIFVTSNLRRFQSSAMAKPMGLFLDIGRPLPAETARKYVFTNCPA
jgi:hypothetical protein